MRSDNLTFATQNLSAAKSPRYTIEVAFDQAATDLHYFTSHDDAATPAAAAKTLGVVQNISGTSQTLDPANARSSIGAITFNLVDKSNAVRDLQYTKLLLGKSLRGMRVRIYIGFEGLVWDDYVLVQTQLIDYVSFDGGIYKFQCSDIQREERKDVFDLATTNLALSISESDTTIEGYDTSKFTMVAHGASYSDAPGQTVGYFKIDKETIRYTGKTATSFTGCTRGVLNTKAEAHQIDPGAAQERRAKIEEYVYLEMPAVKLIYAVLTGKLYGQGANTLPSAWHLGIADSYVRLADLTDIGADLWNTVDDTQGVVTRFEGLGKQDGKQFIEKELLLLLGLFSPVYADGALGLRRMSGVLSGASYVLMLDERNVSRAGELKHDMQGLQNNLGIEWNWDDLNERLTRFTALLDANSISVHGKANPLRLKFRGLTGNNHTTTTLAKQFDALRDRFAGPPLRIQVECLPSLNVLEVGDVVRLRLASVRDFVSGGTLDRSFEIQNISIDWITGKLTLALFGSSQQAGAISHTTDNTVIDDAWYIGTDLASVLTIAGGVITANGNLAGAADMANAIYYYNGDLTVGVGVTVTINNNVQLRIKGHLTVNGTFDGKGRGLAGAAAPNPPTSRMHYNAGTPGFIGATEAGGNLLLEADTQNSWVSTTIRGASGVGFNDVTPAFNLKWSGSALLGLPPDLRGSSGASGMPFTAKLFGSDTYYLAGNGGPGGAGLIIVCRGMSFGVSGKLDLGGGNGVAGSATVIGAVIANADSIYNAGSGAGGAPGGCLVALDGASALAPDLGNTFIAQNGMTPITGNPPTGGVERHTSFDFYSYFIGTGDGTTFPLPDLGGYNGGCRIQYVLAEPDAVQDADVGRLRAPTSFQLFSGTAALYTQGDGTVVPRIQATWVASTDPRVAGYELQFKLSSGSDWSLATVDIIGRDKVIAYLTGVKDGLSYDVRMRSRDGQGNSSDWVTVTNHVVIGKSALPADVPWFLIDGDRLTWGEVSEVDRAGYRIKYHQGINRNWINAIALHNDLISNSPYTLQIVPTGQITLMIKTVDTSGNESENAAYIVTDLGDPMVANVIESADFKALGWTGTLSGGAVSGGNLLANSVGLMWNAESGVYMWANDGGLMWQGSYSEMIYLDSYTVMDPLDGSQMTISFTAQGETISLYYRPQGSSQMWSVNSGGLMWSADSAAIWQPPPDFKAWPGNVTVKPDTYDFKIITGFGQTQGSVTEFTVNVDAPDIIERCNDVAISAGGTRLPIIENYRVIKNVNLTLEHDGGNAISAKWLDKDAALGPLVKCFDASNVATGGVLDATIQGY